MLGKGIALRMMSMLAFGMSAMRGEIPRAREVYRGPTGRRKKAPRTKPGVMYGYTGAKTTRAFESGRATCRHGAPYNTRECLMKLKALEMGQSIS
jgi:hypothetical protein